MKSKVDKLDAPVDLSKLNDVAKNVVKKDAYNAKIKNIEDKIPDITNLATKTTLNAKINEVKGEPLTAVENKIPNVSNFVKKTDYNTKIKEIENKFTTDHDHDKHIATQEFNILTLYNFTARLKQANFVTKYVIFNFVKMKDFDNKLKSVISNKNKLPIEKF